MYLKKLFVFSQINYYMNFFACVCRHISIPHPERLHTLEARVETLIKNALHASGDFTRVSFRLVCKLRVYINESKYMRETESGYCTPAIHRGCPLQFRVDSANQQISPRTEQILNVPGLLCRKFACIFAHFLKSL